jgi:hypothetical protein
MDWTPVPQTGDWEVVDRLGRDLSAILHCPVRFCAYQYDKPVFECKCLKNFPKFSVLAAQESGDWSLIMERHNEKD